MSDLNEEKTLLVAREDFGKVKILKHRGRQVQYRLPKEIEDRITLRFKGCGKTANQEAGDLLLHVEVDRRRDLHGVLWLSESQARIGVTKQVLCGKKCLAVEVPPSSVEGQVIRLKGIGKSSVLGKLFGSPARGDAFIAIRVFADQVVANFAPVEAMSTENLFLEGWVYRRIDEILAAIGNAPFTLEPFTAIRAAGLYSELGWKGVASALLSHLGLQGAPVSFQTAPSLEMPGQCQTRVPTRNNRPAGAATYTVSIHSKFLDNPFAVTAILAHELCHILEARHFGQGRPVTELKGSELMEMERTVDLLVFLFGLGEFQMRVARQSRMTLGYFNQELFERMHVIWSRKQKEFLSRGPNSR